MTTGSDDGKKSMPLLKDSFAIPLATTVTTRTLVAAGFTITDFRRQPQHGEYFCEQVDAFGASIRYLFAICETGEPVEGDLSYIRRTAEKENRILVVVARQPGETWIGWDDFIAILGGAVPIWRALAGGYADILRIAAQNRLPPGLTGEAWQIFEDTVADGLEFIFGRRVRRMGGRRRGQRVSDMITLTPDDQILIVDTKASASAYDVGAPELRPLVEYVKSQKIRQRGRLDVSAAILVADKFKQDQQRLKELSGEFLSEVHVPLTFLEVEPLLKMISQLGQNPLARNTIRWSHIFCSGGPVLDSKFEQEYKAAIQETYPK
jgi:hypothetical protein